MDWDNLRFFLELARSGKLVSAARRLGVDHTTVARRIQALEKEIGTQLFSRQTAGYTITEAGRRLLTHAESMESACLAVEREAPEQGGLAGIIRIGTTEGFGTVILTPRLASFTQRHPRLSIDLLAVPKLVNLSRREADIVIALERPERGSVQVARLTDYTLRLYASTDYLAAHPAIRQRDDLSRHAFVGYVDDLLYSKELRYLNELCRPERFALRSTSILAQHQATAAGAGIAVLPAFLADADPRLRAVLPHEARLTRTFWMSMPAEIKHLSRMQAAWQFLQSVATDQQSLLHGTDATIRAPRRHRATAAG